MIVKPKIDMRFVFFRIFTCIILTLVSYGFVGAQDVSEQPAGGEELVGNGIYLGVFYGANVPGGDLADRFGSNFTLGGTLELFKNKKWVFGVEGQFIFSNNVKETVFGGLVTDQGYIIGSNFTLADIDIRERGINAFAKVGRVHDLWSDDNISGIKWTIGVGYFQHKIRLVEAVNSVPFFEDPYVRGYDRLTNGVGITQFLGYQFLDSRGRLNFFIGLEATEAFTQDRRKLNYNSRTVPKESRLDLMFGAKVGFQITIRRFQNPEEIWY